MHILQVTQRDAAKELEVYQFQYTKWADHDVPLDVSHVFAYIEAIERLKEKQKSGTNENRSVIVIRPPPLPPLYFVSMQKLSLVLVLPCVNRRTYNCAL